MNRRGNIVIAVLFVLLLSFSGLALLTQSLVHGRIIAARRGKWQLCGKMESLLMQQLHGYRQRLDDSDLNLFTAPENDFFNTLNFPSANEGDVEVKNHFSRHVLIAGGGFAKVRVFNTMTAGSEKSRLEYGGKTSVDLLKGDIPLSEFTLLVNMEMPGTQSAYLAGKGVEWSGPLVNLPGKPPVTGDCRSVLAAALKLSGPIPDWRQIREKFGLEPSAAPVPPGIYLTRAAGLVETIFVEGDLQRLEFRALDGLQTVVFEQDARRSELSYRPGQGSLLWSGNEAVHGFCFGEKIIVHGNILAIEQTGQAAFAADSSIQVLASGKITVCSGLAGESLELQKAHFAHLLLMTANKDFFSGAEVNADIVLAAGDGSTVEAHILAAGNVVHGAGLLNLSGSLIANDIRNSGRLRARALAGQFSFPAHLDLKNFTCLQNFRIHFIAEGSDE